MGVFIVFISDFRKKTGMVPLVNEKITKILKLSYFVPVIICAYTLTIMDYITSFDFVALALTFVGAVVVVKTKLDLGICHTWAGYCKQSSELEVSGIYSYMRHPLYMGVHLFSIGVSNFDASCAVVSYFGCSHNGVVCDFISGNRCLKRQIT